MESGAVGALSGLTGLAIGVAPVALGLAGRFVFEDARNVVVLGSLTGLCFGACLSRHCGLARLGFGLQPFPFFDLSTLTSSATLFPRGGNRLALGLACELVRLGRLGGTVGLQLGSLCIGGGAATIEEFVASGVFQISVPFEVWCGAKVRALRRVS